jgi:lipopolysaccharide export system protein LptA
MKLLDQKTDSLLAAPLGQASRTSKLAALAGFIAMSLFLFSGGHVERAEAQSLPDHNSNAPIDVSAEALDVSSRAGRASYVGNVVVRQDRLTIRAARVSVAFTTGGTVDINRVEATGTVTVSSDDLNARSNTALYDLDSRLITMIGNVELTQRGNRLTGNRLVINVGSGRATLTGSAGRVGPDGTTQSGTTSGGRVTGRFTVPQRDPQR